jgi:hypothetical protein
MSPPSELQLCYMKLSGIRLLAQQLQGKGGPLPPIPPHVESREQMAEFVGGLCQSIGQALEQVLDDEGVGPVGQPTARGTLLGPGGRPLNGRPLS